MREEIFNWFSQGERDLISAKNSFTSKDYYASVFWCQQSIEKGLKSIILFKFKNKFVPEHSLVRLGKKVKIPKKYETFLKKLSPQYFLARYPDASEDMPSELYDKTVSKEFLNKSIEVSKWIKNQLK
jgi:HEPN domain-containing protein